MIASVLLVLHLLGAVIWVGGMFFALLVLRPSLAAIPPETRLALHGEVFRRFFRVIWHVMPIMLLTGYLMLFLVYGGFANVGWNVHVMNTTGLVMSGIFVFIALVPFRRLRRADAAGDRATAVTEVGRIRSLIVFNLVLGLITVAVAAWR